MLFDMQFQKIVIPTPRGSVEIPRPLQRGGLAKAKIFKGNIRQRLDFSD